MYIEFLHPSPKAGQKEHVSKEDAHTLVLAGFAQYAVEPAAPIKPPFFGIHVGAMSGAISLQFKCEACQRVDYYGGPATDDNFVAIERMLCAHAKQTGGLPQSARDAYRAALKDKVPATSVGTANAAIAAHGGKLQDEAPYHINPYTGEKFGGF